MTLLLIVLVLVVIGVIPALARRGSEGHRFGTVLNGPDGRSLRSTRDKSRALSIQESSEVN